MASIVEDVDVQPVKSRKQRPYLIGNPAAAAYIPAFHVERHIGIMERHAQQRPAIGEQETYAFIGWAGNADAGRSSPFFKRIQYKFAIIPGFFTGNFQTVFPAFCRFPQIFDKTTQTASLRTGAGSGNDQFDGQIGTVIEVIVFTESS